MTTRPPIHLIINADDYGYFPCVSRGILDAANSHALTATGILSNSLDLHNQLERLDSCEDLDLGVHLNLTFRQPLTAVMAEKLIRWGGVFPGVYQMSMLILKGEISIKDIRSEWSAQIEACQHKKLSFLNSHEHIHMLPNLFPLVLELAQEYEIPYVRMTRAEWRFPCGINELIRNGLMQVMASINWRRLKVRAPLLLGLSSSGRLNYGYLAKIFARLEPGKAYELMCHPGFFDASEIADPRLISYHDWEGELKLLQSQKLQALYEKYGIHLSHYHDLNI